MSRPASIRKSRHHLPNAGDQWPDGEEQEPLEPATIATIAAAVTSAEQASALTPDPEALIGELGAAIDNRADRLHVPAAAALNGLLPAVARSSPSVRVMLNEDSTPPAAHHLEPFGGSTGSNKSETSDISVRPLYRFQEEPALMLERSFFTSSFTSQAVRVQAGQPDNGCLINPDELSLCPQAQGDQQGTTDDLRLLSIYDGRPFAEFLRQLQLNLVSLLSTIQPSVLLKYG